MTVTPQPRRRRLGVGAAVVLALTIAAVTVLIGVVRTAAAPVDVVPMDEQTVVDAPVYVHVAGAVAEPGLYRLDEGARVVDVIAAAGGFADGADRDAVNLARVLSDGEQLWVPKEGETEKDAGGPGAGPGTGPGGSSGDGRVNLNTADAAALDTLPRIGPALAARILQWREDNGRFTSVDDLLSVPGIGEKMLAGLRDLVTV